MTRVRKPYPSHISDEEWSLALQLHFVLSLTLWITMIQGMITGGASVEETLELWVRLLRSAKDRIAPLFTQKRVADSACSFLDVLIGNDPRKTGWMRAEAAGDPGPWRQQALLGRGRWDADALRDVVREHVIEHLGTEDGVMVIDETGFLKKGQASCGVRRQYTGSAGKITNCQIGVFATPVSARGHAFIDRALYLPKDWTSNRDRLQQTHVSDDVVFATKPALASMMIERSIEAGVPFRWVAADSMYGVGDVERTFRRAGIGYVLGVKGNHWFGSWATDPLIAGKQKILLRLCQRMTGAACLRGTAQRVSDCMTGHILRLPIWMQKNLTAL